MNRKRHMLVVAEYNAKYTMHIEQFSHDIARLVAHGADVICLLESRGRERFDVLNAIEGYTLFTQDVEHAGGQLPILVRDNVIGKVLDHQLVPMCPRGVLGLPPPRYAHLVKFRHAETGRRVNIVATHFNSHVEKGGRARLLPRVRNFAKHMWALLALVRSLHGQVIVVGDFNVDAHEDHKGVEFFPNLATRGLLKSVWDVFDHEGGTHGNRLIDYVFFRPSRAMRPLHVEVLRGFHSDHRPVVVTFQLDDRN